MKKRLNEIQEAESLFIRKWCLTIIDFIFPNNDKLSPIIELRRQAFDEETKTRFLEKASPIIYLKGLREAYNDINNMALNAPDQTLRKLNKLLFAQFGRDLNTYSGSFSSLLEGIIKRGKIVNDEEFRLVEQTLSDISQIDAESQQTIKYNDLLTAYLVLKNK